MNSCLKTMSWSCSHFTFTTVSIWQSEFKNTLKIYRRSQFALRNSSSVAGGKKMWAHFFSLKALTKGPTTLELYERIKLKIFWGAWVA